MTHYLLYCCVMIFVLISVLLATSQRAQAQTREAYVAQSEDKSTLTFYYDALRATRTGTTWGIEETKKEGAPPPPHGQEHTRLLTGSPRAWCLMPRSEISVPPPQRCGFIIVKH